MHSSDSFSGARREMEQKRAHSSIFVPAEPFSTGVPALELTFKLNKFYSSQHEQIKDAMSKWQSAL